VNDTKPSKSARKREVIALQELGEALIGLSADQLATIDTDEYLIEQVKVAQSIASHGALRRQKQLIGKIMRGVDPLPIREALDRIGQSDQQSRMVFRQAEQWRDRIVAGGPAELDEFASSTGCPPGTLKTCLNDLLVATDDRRRQQARRQLFREIHGLLWAKMHSTAD